jgi:hypothetical protein
VVGHGVEWLAHALTSIIWLAYAASKRPIAPTA